MPKDTIYLTEQETANFLKDPLPKYLEDLLQYDFIISLFICLMFVAAGLMLIYLIVFSWRHYRERKKSYCDSTPPWLSTVVLLFFTGICFLFASVNNSWLEIKVSPKTYLIKNQKVVPALSHFRPKE